ncbi:MAG: ABC transporter ATP-binding protein [Verrucomicrobiota bacterium JB024]|nr:ABC transporter ATP-binding protein [Verrucomicrobiota bacterium JB024]
MSFFNRKPKGGPARPQAEFLNLSYSNHKVLYSYLRFYAEDRWKLVGALILNLIKSSPIWVTPIITANILNLLDPKHMAGSSYEPGLMHQLVFQATIGAIMILQNIPTHIWYVWEFSKVNRKVEWGLRSSLCERLQHLSIPYHQNSQMGVMQTKVLRDVENVETLTRMLIDTLPNICVTFSVALIVTSMRAPQFLLFYLVTIPTAVVVYKCIGSRMKQRNQDFRHSIEDMSGRIIEMLRMIPVTRAHNVERTELERVNAKLNEVKHRGLRLDVTNSIFGSINWVVFMAFNLLTLVVAVWLNLSGRMNISIGNIVLITTYFNSITGAVMGFMNVIPAVAKGLESVKSIGEILECPDIEKNEDKPKLDGVTGHFDFQKVCFSYDKTDRVTLHEIELDVKPGEMIALVGPSGSGKSTLMQLLIGFIRPTEGRILLDGRDMNEIDLRSYRRFISVVSQESILFDGTIADNITYGAHDPTPEMVDSAIKSANLHEFIKSLPDGLDTRVKENGARLSGGQKQRMAIARALLRDPRVLLLDEATSALDVESEALIQDALKRLIKGRTTFIVAHRLSTIRNADRIVVLHHGKIREIGTHDDLLKQKGIYYRMHRLQSEHTSSEEAVSIGLELESEQ